MAWELQSHMEQYIAPSINKEAFSHENPKEWLAERLADCTWEEGVHDYDTIKETFLFDVNRFGVGYGVERLTEFATETATTTNGGRAFYLDKDLWLEIEWCSEDETQAWYC